MPTCANPKPCSRLGLLAGSPNLPSKSPSRGLTSGMQLPQVGLAEQNWKGWLVSPVWFFLSVHHAGVCAAPWLGRWDAVGGLGACFRTASILGHCSRCEGCPLVPPFPCSLHWEKHCRPCDGQVRPDRTVPPSWGSEATAFGETCESPVHLSNPTEHSVPGAGLGTGLWKRASSAQEGRDLVGNVG